MSKTDDKNQDYLHIEKLYHCYAGHLSENQKEEYEHLHNYNYQQNEKINFNYENVLIFYQVLQSKII